MLQHQFGVNHDVASGSITNIVATGKRHGDPCHTAAPRFSEGRTLSDTRERVMTEALDADASQLTTEL